ncbi:MAG: acyl-ACP--UDP-N-acetylglucosamine O-acyltransferase [Myxococcaceae bacterium]
MQIHATAIIDPKAHLSKDVHIGAYSIIGPGVYLEDRVKIHEHVVIKCNTRIGEDSEIYPFVSLGESAQDLKSIQDNNILIIGARTTIREHSSIHAASQPGKQTQLGSDCFIMGQVHIGHDCNIGNHVIITQASMLAGHVTIHDFANLSGNVAVHQGVSIGKHVFVGGKTGVRQDIAPYCSVEGHPARLLGLNSVGLKRHGFLFEDRLFLKKAFKILFMSNLLIEEACKQLELYQNPMVDELLQFARNSKRGLLRKL